MQPDMFQSLCSRCVGAAPPPAGVAAMRETLAGSRQACGGVVVHCAAQNKAGSCFLGKSSSVQSVSGCRVQPGTDRTDRRAELPLEGFSPRCCHSHNSGHSYKQDPREVRSCCADSSREVLRRWETMMELHRTDPELGFREQIEAADTLDADPYARLRLLLLEQGAHVGQEYCWNIKRRQTRSTPTTMPACCCCCCSKRMHAE